MLEGARIVNATSKKAGAQTAFTMQRLWRQAVWGCIAAAALLLAILAGFTDAGSQRAELLFVFFERRIIFVASDRATQAPSQPVSRSLDSDYVVRQLTQTVRGLVEDRDRMAKRLAAVERNLDDMTGSISQQIEAAKAPSARPPPVVSWLATATTAVDRRAGNVAILRLGRGAATDSARAAAAAPPPDVASAGGECRLRR